MFDFVTGSIENGLDILGDLASGELPTKRMVAKLLSDGLSIYAISEATGVAVDLIEKIIED